MTSSHTAPASAPASTPVSSPAPWLINAVIGVLAMIWGSTYFVIRAGLEDLPPFTGAGARFALACLVMAAVAHVLGRREGGRAPSPTLSVVMGVCNFSVNYAIVYWSETILPSGLVSVLWAVFPMMMAICAHLFLPGERLGARQWSGFVVGFAGIALLFSTDLRAIGPAAIPAGLVLLLSPAISAVGQTWVKRDGKDVSSLLLNRNGMVVGAVLLLAAAFLFERDAPMQWSARALGSVAYLALAGTVITFGLYFWALRHAPAYRMSVIAYLTPALALTLGAVLGSEPVHLHTLGGVALILGGVALVIISKPGTGASAARRGRGAGR